MFESNDGMIHRVLAEGRFSGFFGGYCPVQGYGWVQKGDNTHQWYFRARGDNWLLSIGKGDDFAEYVPCDETIWEHGRTLDGHPFAAGYLTREEVAGILTKAFRRYFEDSNV